MSKLTPTKPFLFILYGFPGSGKTYFARQLCDNIQAAHVQADRIRYELFDEPRYTKQENAVVLQIVNYMVEEFLRAGVSVVYDMNAFRLVQRRALRDIARKSGAVPILMWQQIDADSALNRAMKRDRRKADDRYALQPDYTTFQRIAGGMQNPESGEEYIVTSGKHVFNTQMNTVLRYMYQKGIIMPTHAPGHVAKPGLVNLVPNPNSGRVDMSRRNITIR
jgi:predicted kinase